jgi:hypothetical protein
MRPPVHRAIAIKLGGRNTSADNGLEWRRAIPGAKQVELPHGRPAISAISADRPRHRRFCRRPILLAKRPSLLGRALTSYLRSRALIAKAAKSFEP